MMFELQIADHLLKHNSNKSSIHDIKNKNLENKHATIQQEMKENDIGTNRRNCSQQEINNQRNIIKILSHDENITTIYGCERKEFAVGNDTNNNIYIRL